MGAKKIAFEQEARESIRRGVKKLARAVKRARSTARRSFGSDELYLEKQIRSAHHVEVQVFGLPDGDDGVGTQGEFVFIDEVDLIEITNRRAGNLDDVVQHLAWNGAGNGLADAEGGQVRLPTERIIDAGDGEEFE